MHRRFALTLLAVALVFGQNMDHNIDQNKGKDDPLAAPGFQHFYNLEYDEALAYFRAEAARNPDSPDVYNHIAQTILYREMFRSGALESELVTGSNPFLRRAGLNPSAADVKE